MSAHENNGLSDEWYTPKYIFNALSCVFDMDVASPMNYDKIHTPTKTFITNNSLNIIWKGFVWMNPPFGKRNGLEPWLDKIEKHGNGIALTPDRSSASWWQKSAKGCDALLHVHGKIKFIKPNGESGNSPSCGTTLFAFGEKAVMALQNAQKNGLGILFVKPTIDKIDIKNNGWVHIRPID